MNIRHLLTAFSPTSSIRHTIWEVTSVKHWATSPPEHSWKRFLFLWSDIRSLFCIRSLDRACALRSSRSCTQSAWLLVTFHKLMTALNTSQPAYCIIYCTHFTAVVHNKFWLHNRLFCLPVTLSIVHSFIWMEGWMTSLILSGTPLHDHKWTTALHVSNASMHAFFVSEYHITGFGLWLMKEEG
jgi:hypothetical protein